MPTCHIIKSMIFLITYVNSEDLFRTSTTLKYKNYNSLFMVQLNFSYLIALLYYLSS